MELSAIGCTMVQQQRNILRFQKIEDNAYLVGEYAGLVGEYAGDVGEYAGLQQEKVERMSATGKFLK